MPRSSYYYRAQEKDEREVKAAIEEVARAWPTYGYHRIAVQLRREKDWVINQKRVRCLMKEMGLEAKTKRKKQRTINREHSFPNRCPHYQGLS